MKKCEKDEIRDKAATMSDKELSEEYHNTVYSTLGSNSERMEECGCIKKLDSMRDTCRRKPLF